MSDTDLQRYYDESYPPELWLGGGTVNATGATAGIPGSWTPAGSTPPADVTSMGSITASPATAWTTGQYVQTGTPGVIGQTHWNGTAWAGGPAALMTDEPGAFTIPDVKAWVEDNPDEAEEVLEAEEDRGDDARVTLLDWLHGFIAHRDEEANA